MLPPFASPFSNHASTTSFPSPLLLNSTSFNLSQKSPNFLFPCKPFNLPALRSVTPMGTSTFLPHLDINETKSKKEFFEVELQVRDYELDQYGVVHNSIYASYCQQGCHEFLKTIGIHCDVMASSGNTAFAMSELSCKFIAPLRNGDRFVVKVRVSGFSTVRLYFDHFIYKLPNQEPILEARSTTCMLNKNYRPIRLPEDVKANIVKSMGSHDKF